MASTAISKGDKIQVSVNTGFMHQFESLLFPSSTVLIKNFNLGSNSYRYTTLSYATKKILFTEKTSVVESVDFEGPTHGFQFASFADIENAKFHDRDTVDVIGFVTGREEITPYVINDQEKERLSIKLSDLEGRQLRCSFFNNYTRQVDALLSAANPELQTVLIVQFGKINVYQDKYTVTNAYNGTIFYCNVALPEVDDLRARLHASGIRMPTMAKLNAPPCRTDVTYLAKAFNDLSMVSLSELSNHTEIKMYALYATIDCIHYEYGWYYTSCRRCNRVLRPLDVDGSHPSGSTVLVCDGCRPKPTMLCPRYKVEFTAVNKTGSASFTLFDGDVQRLLKLSCADLLKRLPSTTTCPEELTALVGLTMLFKIEVSEYNLVKNYKVYTIKEVTNNVDFIKSFFYMKGIDEDVIENIDLPIPLLRTAGESSVCTSSNMADISPLGKRQAAVVLKESGVSVSPTKHIQVHHGMTKQTAAEARRRRKILLTCQRTERRMLRNIRQHYGDVSTSLTTNLLRGDPVAVNQLLSNRVSKEARSLRKAKLDYKRKRTNQLPTPSAHPFQLRMQSPHFDPLAQAKYRNARQARKLILASKRRLTRDSLPERQSVIRQPISMDTNNQHLCYFVRRKGVVYNTSTTVTIEPAPTEFLKLKNYMLILILLR